MTFLITKKMHPALAARIEASVTSNQRTRGKPKPRTVAIVRIAFFVALALFFWAIVALRAAPGRKMDRMLEKARMEPSPATSAQRGPTGGGPKATSAAPMSSAEK